MVPGELGRLLFHGSKFYRGTRRTVATPYCDEYRGIVRCLASNPLHHLYNRWDSSGNSKNLLRYVHGTRKVSRRVTFSRSPTNWGQGRQAENDLAPRVPELSFRASARHGSFVAEM
jgi:hypothetical protein